MVFQQPSLLPWRSALDNVAVGLQVMGVGKAERRARAREWLRRVQLGDAEGRYPVQLSGGMRQRVSLARAFVVDPGIVLLDESLSALDEVTARALRRDITELADSTRTTAVVVTHNISEAFELAHRVIVLARPARIVREYSTADVDPGDVVAFALLREEIHRLMGGELTV